MFSQRRGFLRKRVHFSLEERISETREVDFFGEGDSLGKGGAFFFKEGIS